MIDLDDVTDTTGVDGRAWFDRLRFPRGFQGGRGQGDERGCSHDPLPRRLGAEAWAFGRLHPREAVGQYGAALFLLPFQIKFLQDLN